eukprot:TRINITY_DN93_c0_g1_i1.p1 TRINITY_DN93_c0_g1~~TRINITY_DN93_c0_g1_i1.p1  ORF type:complete len:2052 (-),score=797.91 TRINITY_DN93_c0_g1_i1:729-6884(-)
MGRTKPRPESAKIPKQPALNLEFAHGFRGARCRNNLFYLSDGKIVYQTAACGVVYDPKTHKQEFMTEHDDDIISLAMHPDGKTVATGQIGKNPKIIVWDSSTMKVLSVIQGFHERGVCALTFSPKGDHLVSVGLDDYHSVAVWKWKSGHCLMHSKGHGDRIFEVQYNPARDEFVTIGVKHVAFWTFKHNVLKKKKGIFGRVGPLQTMLTVMFDKDGTTYTGSLAGDVYAWDSNKLKGVNKGAHKGPIYAMLETQTNFYTAGKDGILRKWGASFEDAGQIDLSAYKVYNGELPCPRAITMSRDGSIALGLKTSDIITVDEKSGKVSPLLDGHAEGELWGLDTHPSKQEFATASDDKSVRLWDAESHKQIAAVALKIEARSIGYSPDGKHLAVGLINGGFQILDATTLKTIFEDRDRKEAIHAIKYSPDGKYLAVGSHDNFIDFYDTGRDYKRCGVGRGHSSYVTHLDWSADSKMVQSNSGDYETLFWDATNKGKRIVRTPPGAEWDVQSKSHAWATWSCVLGDVVEGIWPKYSDKTDVNSVHLSNDKSTLASGDDFGLVKLFRWPPENPGSRHSKHRGHSAHVTNVRWTAGDKHLISIGGGDQTILIWSAHDDDSDCSESDDEGDFDLEDVDSELEEELSKKYPLKPSKEELRAMKLAVESQEAAALAAADPLSAAAGAAATGPTREVAVRATRPSKAKGKGKMKADEPEVEDVQRVSYRRNQRRKGGRPGKAVGTKPKEMLEIDFIHGYRGFDTRDNMFYNPEGKIVYHAAAAGIVYDPKTHTQKYFLGHDDDILSLCVSPDRKLVATGQIGKNPKICVWDSVTCELLSVMQGFHQRGVTALTFNQKGDLLASVGLDDFNSLAIYRWRNGVKLAHAKGHSDKIVGIEWSPFDESQLATCGVKHISFWNHIGNTLKKSKGKFGKKAKVQTILSIAYSPDGFVYTGTTGGDIFKWKDSRCVDKIRDVHDGPVFSVQPSSGGFVSGGKDGVINTYDKNFEKLKTLECNMDGRDTSIRAVDFENGKILAGTRQSQVIEVDPNSGKATLLLEGHAEGEVWGLATHPTKNIYVTASDDKSIRLWDVSARKTLVKRFIKKRARSAVFSPDGSEIAVGLHNGGVMIVDGSTLEQKELFRHRKEAIHAIKYSPDGLRLAVGSHDNFIDLYKVKASTKNYKRYGICRGHSSFITHLDFSENSRYLQTDSGDYEHLYWFSNNGKHLTKTSQMADVQFDTWTCVLGEPVTGIWPAYSDRTDVNAVARNNKRNLLATADDFGFVKIFRYPADDVPRQVHKKYIGHSSHVTNVRWTADDKYLLSVGGNDQCVFQWKVGGQDVESDESPDEFSDSDSDLAADIRDPDEDRRSRAARNGPSAEQIEKFSAPQSEVVQAASRQDALLAGASSNAPAAATGAASALSQIPGTPARDGRLRAAKPQKEEVQMVRRPRESTRAGFTSGATQTEKASMDLDLEFVHGVRMYDCYNNIMYSQKGELVYHTAATGIVYDKKSHTQKHFRGHTDDILSLHVHPEGDLVATGEIGKDPKTIVWSSSSLEEYAILSGQHYRGVNCVGFSNSGKRLATVGLDDDHTLVVWKWKSADVIATAKGHTDKILSVSWAPNDEYLVTCGVKHIKFWLLRGNQLIGKKGIFGKNGSIQTIIDTAFGPDGTCYTGTASGAIYAWKRDPSNKNSPLFKCAGAVAREGGKNHSGPLFGLAATRNGFISGGKDGKVLLWDSKFNQTGAVNLPESGGPGKRCIRAIASGPSGEIVVGTKRSEIYEVSGSNASLTLAGHAEGELWGLATHPSKHIFVTASDDKSVRLWDIKTRKQIARTTLTKRVRSAAFSPDGNTVAVGCMDGRWYALSTTDLREIAKKKHCSEEIADLKFSPDGTRLAVGSHDNFVDIYDVGRNFKRIARCKGHSSFITHLDWSDDSRFIQTNSGDYEHLFWDGTTGKHITRPTQLQGAEWATWTCVLGNGVSGIWPKYSDNTDINSVDRSVDQKTLATGDDFGLVKLFAYPAGGRFAPYTKFVGHSSHITNVRFAFDDSYLISVGGNDMAVFQWKTK